MAHWLIKPEPSAYSWLQFVKDKKTSWTGVRNAQAAMNLKAMKPGDRCFFYHSNEGKEIVGIAEVAKAAYPDPTDKDGKAFQRKTRYIDTFIKRDGRWQIWSSQGTEVTP